MGQRVIGHMMLRGRWHVKSSADASYARRWMPSSSDHLDTDVGDEDERTTGEAKDGGVGGDSARTDRLWVALRRWACGCC